MFGFSLFPMVFRRGTQKLQFFNSQLQLFASDFEVGYLFEFELHSLYSKFKYFFKKRIKMLIIFTKPPPNQNRRLELIMQKYHMYFIG